MRRPRKINARSAELLSTKLVLFGMRKRVRLAIYEDNAVEPRGRSCVQVSGIDPVLDCGEVRVPNPPPLSTRIRASKPREIRTACASRCRRLRQPDPPPRRLFPSASARDDRRFPDNLPTEPDLRRRWPHPRGPRAMAARRYRSQ